MTPRISEEFSTRLIDWNPFVIMVSNSMPPRDYPDEDEDDEEDEDRTDELPVVREPDEDQSMIPPRKSRQGFPRRPVPLCCVCLEICCAERCSNVAQAC